MRRILLFISSYVPLYILLIIKNILERCTDGGRLTFSVDQLRNAYYFDEINDFAILILLLFCVISSIYLIKLSRETEDTHYYIVKEIEVQTGNSYFSYISIYLLPCLGLSLNNIVDVFVLAFLMVIVGYIYISNHMTYLNPTLQILGYKVFEGELQSTSTKEGFRTVIIAKSDIVIRVGKQYKGCGRQDFVKLVGVRDE